jgi:hypothetical protein
MIKRLLSSIFIVSVLVGCTTGNLPGGSTTAVDDQGFPDMPAIELAPVETVEVPTIEPNPTPTPSPVALTLNQEFRAPYPGIFFSSQQAAYIIAELEAYQERVAASMESMRTGFQLRLNTETEELRLQINSDRARFRLVIQARDTEIVRLMRLNERIVNRGSEFPWDAVLVGAGGLLVGVIGGFLMGFIAAN